MFLGHVWKRYLSNCGCSKGVLSLNQCAIVKALKPTKWAGLQERTPARSSALRRGAEVRKMG